MITPPAHPTRPEEIAALLEREADRVRKGWPVRATLEELQDAIDEWVHDWIEADE